MNSQLVASHEIFFCAKVHRVNIATNNKNNTLNDNNNNTASVATTTTTFYESKVISMFISAFCLSTDF